MKWNDINITEGTITVSRTIERIFMVEGEKKHTELVISSPKTKNSCREITMSKELLAIVKPLKKIVYDATRCIEAGCDYKTVSVLLGHSNISTTLNLYVHPNMEQKKRCITKMFKSLGK